MMENGRHTTKPIGVSRGHSRQQPTPVTAHVLSAGELTVEVWDHGARLVEVLVPDVGGRIRNVVLRHDDLADYDDPLGNSAYFGATVGRYANRIGNSRFVLDGTPVELAPNEGPHQLHGGPIGFDQHVWETVDATVAGACGVTFRLVSPAGDQGFPGSVTVETSYVVDADELRIETVAVADAPTVFGVTNHAYWNLAGHGDVAGHDLRVDADRYVPVDDALIPVGHLEDVSGTKFDLRSTLPLSDIVAAGGIDHCLVTRETGSTTTLRDRSSGRVLTLRSNQPGLQVYTGQYLARPFSGVCLEPEALPDTPNQHGFGSCVLRPGEQYRHSAAYTFTREA